MDDLENHPDFNDAEWLRDVERRARKQARQGRRVARQRAPRPPRRQRFRLSSLVIAAVMLLFAGGLVALYHIGSAPTAPPTVTDTGTPTVTTRNVPVVDLNNPFADTPAQSWTEEIQTPQATAVVNYSAQQVAAGMDAVRATLTAARLNRQVIVGHDTAPILATMPVDGLGHQPKLDPGRYTYIADGYSLLPVPPRVDGTMTASMDDKGELVIHTNYVYMYAFAPAAHTVPASPWDIDAAMHQQADFLIYKGKPWPRAETGYMFAMNCDLADRNQLAPGYSSPHHNGNANAENPSELVDPSHSLAIPNTCHN